MKKKIVVFTGAGVSAESGIETFRTDNGLWMNYNTDDVATLEGWERNPELVNEFYNKRRTELDGVKPNEAHMLLSDLEDNYDVTIVTQNVDDLHERGGSTNIIHLHGELTKVRSLANPKEIIDWGYKPLTDSDRGNGNARLRPNIVWFGEYPIGVSKAQKEIESADIMIVVGTSFSIGYTIGLVNTFSITNPIYFIDPNPDTSVFEFQDRVVYIKDKAVSGMKKVFKILNK